MSDININFQTEELPNFNLTDKEGKVTQVPCLEIITAATEGSSSFNKQLESVALMLLNNYQLTVPLGVVAVLIEKAEQAYIEQKKSCMSTADSEDSASTQTD